MFSIKKIHLIINAVGKNFFLDTKRYSITTRILKIFLLKKFVWLLYILINMAEKCQNNRCNSFFFKLTKKKITFF